MIVASTKKTESVSCTVIPIPWDPAANTPTPNNSPAAVNPSVTAAGLSTSQPGVS